MSGFVQFTVSRNFLGSLKAALTGAPKKAQEAIREATLYTEKVIKKDFMAVSDGSLIGISKTTGQRRYTKRTKTPGVRTSTGHLKRNTKSTFRIQGGAFEGAIGTNVDYGQKLEKDSDYEFLKPGLEKARPEIKKIIAKNVRGIFK